MVEKVAKKTAKHGFIFACTNKSERELLESLVFATNKAYAYKVSAVKKGRFSFFIQS
jgi:hypothetical protein